MKKNIFVVLNYNDYETTKKFVDKVVNYKIVDSIVLVDNCSSDGSQDKLKRIKRDKVTLLCSSKNKGYGAGNNIGINYVKKYYKDANIIISNPDIIVEEKDLKKLLDVKEKNNIKMIAPYIKEEDYYIRGWKITSAVDEIKMSMPFLAKKRNKIINYDDSYYKDELSKVDVLSGCFFVIDSKAIKDNLFDENVFLYYEENILSKRLNVDKYVYKDAYVIHNHSVTVNKNLNLYKKNKILKQSQMYYVKNYCKSNIIIIFILSILNKLVLFKSKIISK